MDSNQCQRHGKKRRDGSICEGFVEEADRGLGLCLRCLCDDLQTRNSWLIGRNMQVEALLDATPLGRKYEAEVRINSRLGHGHIETVALLTELIAALTDPDLQERVRLHRHRLLRLLGERDAPAV